jgi:GDSL-like Lipase/Acylhydrolase family
VFILQSQEDRPMSHVVLLGDSIFDNAAYVGGGPDVVSQLRGHLPQDWRASLAAVDGAVTADVRRQLGRLPPDATHLVVSIGGNDALMQSPVLDEGASSMAEALSRLAAIRDAFGGHYVAMLGGVLRLGLPTAVCTIYEGRLPDPERRRIATAALTLFNDCILRQAFAHGLPIIDLRFVCSQDADYANPIEPSVQGGNKIAAAIATLLTQHDFAQRRSMIFM